MILAALLACGGTPSVPPSAPVAEEPPAPQAVPARHPVEGLPAGVIRQRMAGNGKPRLINFWATWCGPCVAEMPALVGWARSHPDVGVVFVSVDLMSLRDTKVLPFLERSDLLEGVSHWQIDDPDPAMVLPQLIEGWNDNVPVTLLLSPGGEVLRRYDHAIDEAELASWEPTDDTPGWWNR